MEPMNRRLQDALNTHNAGTYVRGIRGDTHFRLKDKVMQTVNDYDKGVHNGDVGTVSLITRRLSHRPVLV